MKTDKEKFIELIESFGIKKSKYSYNGEVLPKGDVGIWEYQDHPELPVKDEVTKIRLGDAGKTHCEFMFHRDGKFLSKWIV